jgi:hypothetical protein
MRNVNTLETRLESQCIVLVRDFAHEIVGEWKGWLMGSLPMVSIAVTSLVNPEWIHFPLWTWTILIFVGGLLFAMFRVYRELRQQRDALQRSLDALQQSLDALQQTLDGTVAAGPFMLVPFSRPSVMRRIAQEGPGHAV